MRRIAVCFATLVATSAGAFAQDKITFAFTDDDPAYIARMEELVEEFEAANPTIDVDFVTAGYAQIMEQLPLQLSVGQGPDLAKVTDFSLMKYTLDMRPYMQDPDGFASLHGKSLALLRDADAPDSKIGGYTLSQTLNLPFVNVTLWNQAGEPLPEKGASLDEIVAASERVAEKTGIDIPFTMDRSGHRFTGPAFSYGAQYLKDGQFTFPDEAAKAYLADIHKWTESGAFPKEMWGAAGGSRYKNMGDEFVNGNVATYFAGNWMVNPFLTKIGSDFEWTSLDAPCGEAGCIPMPGVTMLAAFKHTKHPESVAKLVEFLGSEKVVRALAEKFIVIPGADAIDNLDYQLDDPNAEAAMKVFVRNKANVTEPIRQWMATPGATALYGAIVQRVSQMIVGELSLQETYSRLSDDVAKLNAER